ncbi:hypothetical protein [Actinoplanes couchii]|nr:hypothetical protein [Actinoplanes couchii]MDR6319267.1 hypothetical protein [Actinoplanes couchii]
MVEIFSGHPMMMRLLDASEEEKSLCVAPALAIAEAQAAMCLDRRLWRHVLGFPGLRALPLTDEDALDVGEIAAPRIQNHPVHKALIGPLMTAQVLHEARTMKALIVTRVPEAYGSHDDVAVQLIQ